MLIAVIALSLLCVVLAGVAYMFYHGACAFMEESNHFRAKYLQSLATFAEVKNKLAAEGILLLSNEEAEKRAAEQAASNISKKELH